MLEQRRVALFRNGSNQAIRIPREFELEGTEAILVKDGSRLIIEPVTLQNRLLARLESLKPLDELLPEFDDETARDDTIF